ncbi:MAG: hypothetical protein WA364_02960 [Candidatus Nitrosopolaris sp.]
MLDNVLGNSLFSANYLEIIEEVLYHISAPSIELFDSCTYEELNRAYEANSRIGILEMTDLSNLEITNFSKMYVLDPIDTRTIMNMKKEMNTEGFSVYDRLIIRFIGEDHVVIPQSFNVSYRFIASALSIIVNILNKKSHNEWRALWMLLRIIKIRWEDTSPNDTEMQRFANAVKDLLEIFIRRKDLDGSILLGLVSKITPIHGLGSASRTLLEILGSTTYSELNVSSRMLSQDERSLDEVYQSLMNSSQLVAMPKGADSLISTEIALKGFLKWIAWG